MRTTDTSYKIQFIRPVVLENLRDKRKNRFHVICRAGAVYCVRQSRDRGVTGHGSSGCMKPKFHGPLRENHVYANRDIVLPFS